MGPIGRVGPRLEKDSGARRLGMSGVGLMATARHRKSAWVFRLAWFWNAPADGTRCGWSSSGRRRPERHRPTRPCTAGSSATGRRPNRPCRARCGSSKPSPFADALQVFEGESAPGVFGLVDETLGEGDGSRAFGSWLPSSSCAGAHDGCSSDEPARASERRPPSAASVGGRGSELADGFDGGTAVRRRRRSRWPGSRPRGRRRGSRWWAAACHPGTSTVTSRNHRPSWRSTRSHWPSGEAEPLLLVFAPSGTARARAPSSVSSDTRSMPLNERIRWS